SERVQALTLLAASVAHEIGNPLNALHIHLQLMERELKKLRVASQTKPGANAGSPPRRATRQFTSHQPSDVADSTEKLEQFLGVAKGEINRLDYIVTQFLQAIRPTPPQIKLSPLNEVVLKTLELLQPELENRGIHVKTRLARQLPMSPIDPAQIQQVLVN